MILQRGNRFGYPLRPAVEHLGLMWSGQFERLQKDEVLRDVIRGVRVTRRPNRKGEVRNALLALGDSGAGWAIKGGYSPCSPAE